MGSDPTSKEHMFILRWIYVAGGLIPREKIRSIRFSGRLSSHHSWFWQRYIRKEATSIQIVKKMVTLSRSLRVSITIEAVQREILYLINILLMGHGIS
jgi:hypothetical protein